MPRYAAVWLDLARQTYLDQPVARQQQIDTRIEQLLENPTAGGSYDARTDQWTTVFGDDAGLIVYAVVTGYLKIIILRLV